MEQNYLQIQNNVVTNLVVWDGGSEWKPPSNAIMLVQSTISAKIWQLNTNKTDYVLTEVMGMGQIGFTWDGTILTTNQEKPIVPIQPVTKGTQTA
jgi:hypothetical protein